MTKNILLLVALFVLAFLAAFLLIGGFDALDGARTARESDLPSFRPKPTPVRPVNEAGPPEERGPGAVSRAEAAEPEGTEGPGAIVATVLDSEGTPLPEFAVDLRPFSGAVRNTEHGLLEIEQVEAGKYVLSVWAAGHMRQDRPGIEVRPGKRTRLQVKLKKGIRPAGRVFDEKTLEPVEGAIIRFYGGGQCRSGVDGTFEMAHFLDPQCLSRIVISHPDYDRFTYNRPTIKDVGDVRLALTRGDSVLEGRITNRTGRSLPQQYRIRLWMERGGNIPPEVRKEITFKPSETFRMKGIHRGIFHLMLEFPGTDMAARHRDLEFLYGDFKSIEIALDGGVLVKGRLNTRTGRAANTKLELINSSNLIAATLHTDAQGTFRVEGVEPGTWRIRAWRGSPITDFPGFDVGRSALVVELDLERQRCKVGQLK